MKKLISICCLAFCLFLSGNLSASAATYVYTLDIEITDPNAISDASYGIAGIEFTALGGEFGADWEVALGDAVPLGAGNWVFENYGKWNLLYDDYAPLEYTPLLAGNALTITSSVELEFADISYVDFINRDVNPQYFTSQNFVEQNPVPIPGGIILLGSGLIGLLGLKRRK